MAYIETPTSTGSGALTDGGYVVTSAHVVWPFDEARVVFSDGSEFLDAPVAGWDLLADLAVVGPLDLSAAPLPFEESESPAIGEDAYLIGYPGEVDAFPQPAIVRGIVSRVRAWDAAGMTYFQTDAAIAGGQSGGALVSESGRLLGISGLSFSEAEYGLVLSMADAAPRVRALIAGGDASGLGARRVPLTGGSARHSVTLSNFWDQRAFLINERAGTNVNVSVSGDNDGRFSLYDSFAEEWLSRDETASGVESGSLTLQYDDPLFLVASQLAEEPGDFTVTCSERLIPLNDPDDGKQLSPGRTLLGNLDFPGDADYFLLTLREGERVEVTASSALADAFLLIDYQSATDEQIIVDDDGGGGLFGTDAQVVYAASHTGSYFVVVQDYDGLAPGGYTLTAREASAGAPLTSTTRADFLDSSGDGANSGGFGLDELRSAFVGLPDSFEELDPATEGLSASGLDIDYLTDAVAYASSEPFQLIWALSGELTDLERIAFDSELSSPSYLDEFRQSVFSVGRQGDRLTGGGTLRLPDLGDNSGGVWADFVSDGVALRMEIAIFTRGNTVAFVYSYVRPGAVPSTTIADAARMLDEAIARGLQ